MNPLLILGVASSAVQLVQEVGKNVSGLKNLLPTSQQQPPTSPFATHLKSESESLSLLRYINQHQLNDVSALKAHTDHLVEELKQNPQASDWLATAQKPVWIEKSAHGYTTLVDSQNQRLRVQADVQPTLDMIFNLQSIENQAVRKHSSSIQVAALDTIARHPAAIMLAG